MSQENQMLELIEKNNLRKWIYRLKSRMSGNPNRFFQTRYTWLQDNLMIRFDGESYHIYTAKRPDKNNNPPANPQVDFTFSPKAMKNLQCFLLRMENVKVYEKKKRAIVEDEDINGLQKLCWPWMDKGGSK